jgi:peptidyl-tRNA hydrolase
MEAAAYVLQDFSAQEKEEIDTALDRAAEAVLTFVAAGKEAAMNKYNG